MNLSRAKTLHRLKSGVAFVGIGAFFFLLTIIAIRDGKIQVETASGREYVSLSAEPLRFWLIIGVVAVASGIAFYCALKWAMNTAHSEKSSARVSVGRSLHRILNRFFSKLPGFLLGLIWVPWLFAGFIFGLRGEGIIRIVGLILLVLLVATYIFLAYGYPDDRSR